jgi:hypothetical protein
VFLCDCLVFFLNQTPSQLWIILLFNKAKNQFKSIRNFALVDFLEIICCTLSENESSPSRFPLKKKLISEQLCNLADLMAQNILLEQHFMDYQWASSCLAEIEESFESELEAIKIFIERLFYGVYFVCLIVNLYPKTMKRIFWINSRDMSVQNRIENITDNNIMWMLMEFIANGTHRHSQFNLINKRNF